MCSVGETLYVANGSWQSRFEHVVWALPVSLPPGTLNLELSEERNTGKKRTEKYEWLQFTHSVAAVIIAVFLDHGGPVLVTADDSHAS